MVWRADAPQGLESHKVRFDLVHYFHGRCLDLGCGPAKIFPAKHIIGIDSDKDLGLFGIKAYPDLPGDVEKLDLFADATIDVIFSSHTLEHIDDHEAALREWWRVLKPGGRLILYLPHADHYPCIGMPGANPDHKHDFRNADITAAMKRIAWRSGQGWVQEVDEVRSGGLEYSFLQVYRKTDRHGTGEYKAPPKVEKDLGIVRLGALGDALWITTVLPQLKAEGWRITLYTQPGGEQVLRHEPNIDEIRVQPEGIFGADPAALQAAYWLHLERKHGRFINLVGSVERHLLPAMGDPNFYLPDEQRRRLMDGNYYESVAKWAGVNFDRAKVRVRFTPTADELEWARAERRRINAPFVVLNPGGSGLFKWWPHAQECMNLLAAQGVHGVLLGETRGEDFRPPEGWRVLGKTLDIRRAFALAMQADVVVGAESAIVNSVAHEAPFKIVLLSHSSPENLTRDWERTLALAPVDLPCYPCHRIHSDWTFCRRASNGASACQNAATAEVVAGYAMQWINGELKEAA